MNTNELHIDPEFEALLPPLTAEEFAWLEASIIKHGCINALVVWDGIVLDGHQRKRICDKYQLPYRTVEAKNVSDRFEAMIWIIDNQLGRKNLSESERAELAVQLKDMEDGGAR